ncbi:MAG: DUF3084 domain-containing protein [Nostocaceae cyanobacterium]|nr:DUF3084 domain-containing protein [Nostocaceae cyanobacterium]
MDAGYILIVAILILGGVIATVGDRIGTRVGKARLSLFNLRPKKTAVLITIITGSLVSASTLGILFAADEGLRKGVFELDDIQRDLRRKRDQLQSTIEELETTREEKKQVAAQLESAKTEKAKTEKELQKINEFFKKALKKQAQTQAQLKTTQTQLGKVVQQYQQAIRELESLGDEKKTLLREIELRKAERQRLYDEAQAAIAQRERELEKRKQAIEQRDRELEKRKQAIQQRDQELEKRKQAIQQRDRKIIELDGAIQKRNQEITKREKVIVQRESRLKELEKQQNFLEREVARLEKYYQSYRDLRLGKLALVKGQVLAAAVVSVKQASAAREAVTQLLQQANRNAVLQLTEPGENPENIQLLQVTKQQIEQLSQKIKDGRQYIVRIFSAGNYVRGEQIIEFFADASLNQIVFSGGEVLASTIADPKIMTSYQLRQRVELLISASQFRARNAGILETIQIDGTFVRFLAKLNNYDQPIEIKAIAAADTYTAGPLKVKLVAIKNGEVIFST